MDDYIKLNTIIYISYNCLENIITLVLLLINFKVKIKL